LAEKKRSEERGVLVLTTVATPAQARQLTRALLAERLCGCVSIVPGIQSLYRWKDRLETSPELLLILKSTRRNRKRLEQRIGELHPYEVPEILALEPASIAPAYARWLSDSVGPTGRARRPDRK
jgi:periplasmic divalent cation tolerance protein